VTVADLLSHRAGLSAPREAIGFEQLLDWDHVTRALAGQSPLWEPGTGYAYHAITHGWLAGELVRRVTGKLPGAYFAELVGPLTGDAWIGLPDSESGRVAHLQASPSQLEAGAELLDAPSEWTGRAMTLGGALPAELVTAEGGFNDPRLRAAQVPGAGGIATADALSAIWSATVVETSGMRLIDDHTVAQAVVPMSWGEPVFPSPGPWPRWGRGFQLDSEARHYLGPASLGHDGAGGQVAFADAEAKVGFAFVTNWLEAGADDRATRIVDALRLVLAGRRDHDDALDAVTVSE